MIAPLHPLERGYLYAYGILRFRPVHNAPRPTGRPVGVKNKIPFGRVKKLARQFLELTNGTTMPEFSARHKVSYESFKAAVWKQRRDREAAA